MECQSVPDLVNTGTVTRDWLALAGGKLRAQNEAPYGTGGLLRSA
jgi:hypothetical protein